MYVRHLTLDDFRSWAGVDLTLDPGPSVFVGSNGQGKTNLVEGLGYVATLGSHRVATDLPLVRAGAERAVVRCAVVSDGRELRVEVEINPKRANRARLNGSPVARPQAVLGALRWVLFAPEDLAIVRGEPGERRRFLDDLVVARTPRLAGVRADYERVLRQRGALLKSLRSPRSSKSPGSPGGDDPSGPATLDVWDGQLAAYGAQLLAARLAVVRVLRPWTATAYAQVAPSGDELTMRYTSALQSAVPELADPAAVPDVAALEAALLAELARLRPVEIDRGVNLVGPHRDDFDLGIGAFPVRGYASHGEGWSVALALRLGSYELLRDEFPRGAEPVLVLDDVFAELDSGRREHLALAAAKAEQTIVTAAVLADVPEQLFGACYEVRDAAVHRVA